MKIKYHGKGKSRKIKLIAMAIKGFTGTIGASAILTEHPYWGLIILAIGAAANETTNFIDVTENDEPESL